MESLLLDACAIIWIMQDEDIEPDARRRINEAASYGRLFVSPISAWEIGMLFQKGRIQLSMTVEDWFAALLETPGISLAGMPPRVLIASTQLIGVAPSDPADRIMIATARSYNMSVVTRDRKILSYGDAGHVRTLPC
jgi:PIN domain nuclease of toxin-antitoxin system